MKKWITGGLAFAIVASTVAFAGPDREQKRRKAFCGEKMGCPMMMDSRCLTRMEAKARELGVTDEQIEAVRSVFEEGRQEMIELREQARAARKNVWSLLKQDNPDLPAVNAAVEEAGMLQIRIKQATIARMLKAREIVGKETAEKIVQSCRRDCGPRRGMKGREGKAWRKGGKGCGPRGPGNCPMRASPPAPEDV